MVAISSALLQTRLVSGASHDQSLAQAFETGEARTVAASRPKGALGRHAQRFIGNSRRHHPSSPDMEQSRRRKRKWGGSSCLPDWMREHYTEGERAALAVVVQQVKRQGYCDLRINDIAQLAGVHRTTVQNAMRKARQLRHVAVQERPGVAGQLSLTNIVRIISGAWKAWLRRVGSGFKSLHPSEMKGKKKAKGESVAPLQGAYEREKAALPRIPEAVRHAGPKNVTDENVIERWQIRSQPDFNRRYRV